MNSTDTKKAHQPARPAPRKAEKKSPPRRSFFRSLVSHLMVAIIAVLGVSAYVHWNDLLNYTGSRVCSYNVLGKYAPNAPKVPPIVTPKPEQKTPAPSTVTPTDPAPAAKQATQEPKKADTTAAAEQKETAQKKTEKTTDAEEPSPAAKINPTTGLDADLEAARKLFWAKDKNAVSAYEALVKRYPDNPQLLGEMGNVYFKNGDRDKAADSYLAAGKIYSSRKNVEKKAEMLKILLKLDPKKAALLTNQPEKSAN